MTLCLDMKDAVESEARDVQDERDAREKERI
jgi:hypothetical protein